VLQACYLLLLCHSNARWTLNCGIVESILFATILILVTFTQQPDYDELVKALSSSKSSAVAARDELLKCGIDAFPHLIKYIDDKTIVALPHYEVRVSRPENILVTEMTLGTFVYWRSTQGTPSFLDQTVFPAQIFLALRKVPVPT